jgi:hypothetical protein
LNWRELAADASQTLVISEGEKKAAKACQEGLPTIGLGGVWNWRQRCKSGERLTLPSLDEFVWPGRAVWLLPDSDGWRPNKLFDVLAGMYALGQDLAQRGAVVRFKRLPELLGVKVGLDDWFKVEAGQWTTTWEHLEGIALDDPRFKRLAAWYQQWRAQQVTLTEDEADSPVSLDTPNLPALPFEQFPKWLKEMIEAVAAATETPVELAGLMGLAVVATCCQRRYVVRPTEGYSEPLNLWCLPALDSGNRKTAVVQAMTRPRLEWEQEQASSKALEIEQAKADRETIEARIQHLRSQLAKGSEDNEDFEKRKRDIAALQTSLPDVPTHPRLWVQDITPERLGPIMADNDERMALLSDEAGIFDILAGRYNNGIPNLDLFNQSHAGSPVRVDRGGRAPVMMQRPALTIGVSPQPEVLRGLADKPGFRGRGLLARFLYALPVSTLGYRKLDEKPVPIHVENASQSERVGRSRALCAAPQ